MGLRHLLTSSVIIGANMFYDTNIGTKSVIKAFGNDVHKRYSVGGTIMTPKAGLFFNIYKGIEDNIIGYKVSDGYHFGLNILIPGYESINLGATTYHFNDDDKK